MTSCLVADIGATHARFALAGPGAAERRPGLSEQHVFSCANFADFGAALESYRAQIGGRLPELACIAIAGPVHGDQVRMTNLNWSVSAAQVKQHFGFRQCVLLNDYAAVAYALPALESSELRTIIAGNSVENATRAVIGPGSGLGVAALVCAGDACMPLATECGHAALRPVTELEAEIIRVIQTRETRVSAETLLAGAGLVRIHGALGKINGSTAGPLSCKAICEAAVRGSDSLCVQTVDVYCGLLAGFTREVAFYYGAGGGVTLAGNILRQIAPRIMQFDFESRFCGGPGRDYFVTGIPVTLLELEEPGLLGAACWAQDEYIAG